jgi:hypothetical protein
VVLVNAWLLKEEEEREDAWEGGVYRPVEAVRRRPSDAILGGGEGGRERGRGGVQGDKVGPRI